MKQILSVLVLLLLAVAPLSAQQVTQPESITVTIVGGGSISTEASLRGCTVAGIIITDVSWTAANLAITATVNGTDYFAVYDQFGSLVSIAAAANRWIHLSPGDTWGFRSVKLASVDAGTGAATAQAATRTLRIVCRK